MSLAFKPKIPAFFSTSSLSPESSDSKKVTKSNVVVPRTRPAKPWTNKDLATLIELRALALPHVDCGLILKRRAADCSSAVHKHNLQLAIRARRKILVEGVL